jgi:glycosyltransferase involved in cell wall biosynthesis
MRLAIIVPCFNEEAVLPHTIARLRDLLARLVAQGMADAGSAAIFVDDGSADGTWGVLQSAARDATVRAIRLSRNCGHQQALLAGLREAAAFDAVVTIDADLQDDPEAVFDMVRAANAGADIVYGVRAQRSADTLFKRVSAETYYRVLALFGAEIVFNHADFRLMTRRALDALAQFSESNVFLRGLVPRLGFTTAIVHYERSERVAGESKYPFRKMLSFAWEGITSLSVAPLRFITFLGIATCLLAMGIGFWALGVGLLTTRAVPGWTSTVVPLAFIGGVQMLSLGVIGEYVGKIYLETKRRPAFFVSERTGEAPER